MRAARTQFFKKNLLSRYTKHNWLEYSLEKQAAFCFPCMVFGSHASSFSGGTVDDKFSAEGFTNWKKALEKGRGFSRHVKSRAHLEATAALKAYSTTKSIDLQLGAQNEDQLSKKQARIAENRAIISRLMSLTKRLGACGAPFRGHDESESSSNRGLYREMVAWGAEKDPVLEKHLREGAGNAHYLSPRSQNEQIECIGKSVKQEVVKRVKEAKAFSILMDETTDLSHKEQVCCMVRYVLVTDEGKPTEKIEVEERMLSLEETADTTGEHLTDLLLSKLKENGLDVMDVVGQAYDGGANMRGKNKGVQTRIQSINPRALYTYCYAHNLNRSLVNAVSATEKKGEPTECRDCFALIELVYSFVEGSAARHALFLKEQEKLAGPGRRLLHLKGLSETRWNCRAESLRRLKNPVVLQSIVAVVEDVRDTTSDGVIRGTAIGLLNSLRDRKFLTTLVALSPVMDLVDAVCSVLQSPQLDLISAQVQISSLKQELTRWQTETTWVKVISEATELGSLIGVDLVEEPARRQRKIPARLSCYEHEAANPQEGDAPGETVTEASQQPESARKMHRVYRVTERLVTELERRFPSELGDFCILQVSTYMSISGTRNECCDKTVTIFNHSCFPVTYPIY